MHRWLLTALATAALVPFAYNEWHRFGEVRGRATLVERHRAAGDAALTGGDAHRAVVALQRARDLAPGDPDVQRALLRAQAHLVAGAPEVLSAETVAAMAHELAVAIEAGPDDLAVHQVAAGNVAARRGMLAEAEAAYRRALAIDAGLTSAHLHLGRLLAAAGRHDEAEAELGRAVELAGPRAAAPRLALGQALLSRGKHALAAERLREAAEIERSYTALRLLGRAELALEKWPAAVEAFEGALAALPQGQQVPDVDLYDDLANAFFRAGQPQKALENLLIAVRRGNRTESAYNLGLVYEALGETRRAAQTYEEIVGRDPTLPDVHLRLMSALARTGDRENGRKAADRFLALAERLPALAEHRARVEQFRAGLDGAQTAAPASAASR